MPLIRRRYVYRILECSGLSILNLVGRVEERNPTCIGCGYHVGFRSSTRPTFLDWTKQ